MLISKFNLYQTEWLDLVFDDRNKEYGAYNLRRNYASTMVKAMVIAFAGVGAIFGSTLLFHEHAAVVELPKNDTVAVNLHAYVKPLEEVKPKPQTTQPPKAASPVKTIANPPMVAKPDNVSKIAPKNEEFDNAAISQTTSLNGTSGENIEVPVDNSGGGGSGVEPVDNTVHSRFGLEVMPEPVGGDAAWAKFLKKNLRFPVEAQEEGISGRVLLSFIIEKDGHLSDITVDRPAGYGFDEEALRVLKLAKAWKPGMQNGQPVRVKYSIPINFQLSGQ